MHSDGVFSMGHEDGMREQKIQAAIYSTTDVYNFLSFVKMVKNVSGRTF